MIMNDFLWFVQMTSCQWLYVQPALTQLRGLADGEGETPELCDRCAVEVIVADGLFKAAVWEDVQQVQPGPEGSDDTRR